MNAVVKIEAGPAATIFDRQDLAKLADRVRADLLSLNRAWGDGPATTGQIERFEAEYDRWIASGASRQVARCQRLFEVCDHPGYVDENGQLRAAEVSKALAVLVGSFPTSNVPQPAVFTRALLDDVLGLRPCWIELESTCRRLRQSKTFMPAIAEVLTVLREEIAVWSKRYQAVDQIGFYASGESERMIEEAKERVTAAETARLDQEATRISQLATSTVELSPAPTPVQVDDDEF